MFLTRIMSFVKEKLEHHEEYINPDNYNYYGKLNYYDVPRHFHHNMYPTSSCVHLLHKLNIAKENMTPVIDEIIHNASIFTSSDYSSDPYSPICCVTAEKFNGALRASRILNEVNDNLNRIEELKAFNLPGMEVIVNNLCVAECVPNPDTIGPLDRVYIDKDLIRQLIELHEFLGMTIYRLRDMQVCRQTNVLGCVNPPPPQSKSKTQNKKNNSGGWNCCKSNNKKKSPTRSQKSIPKQKSQVSYAQPSESEVTYRRAPSPYSHASETGYPPNYSGYGSCTECNTPRQPYDPRQNYQVQSSQSKDVKANTYCCCGKKAKPEKKPIRRPPNNNESTVVYSPSSRISRTDDSSAYVYDDECQRELAKLQKEYDDLNETLRVLKSMEGGNPSRGVLNKKLSTWAPQKSSQRFDRSCEGGGKPSSIKFGRKSSEKIVNKSSHRMVETVPSAKSTGTVRMSKSKSASSMKNVGKVEGLEQAKQAILECLAELSEVRKFIKEATELEVSLENSVQLSKEPPRKDCCDRRNDTHVHAKLNGIPVVLKLNEGL